MKQMCLKNTQVSKKIESNMLLSMYLFYKIKYILFHLFAW